MKRRLPLVLALALSLGLLAGADTLRAPLHDYITAADGTRIHFMIMGEGSPVVLIHGYTGTAEGNWFDNGVAQALAGNHKVVAIDVRGHGLSDKPTDPERYGPWMWQDVIQVMNHLQIAKAHVHGYSMGGYITTQLLTHYPNRFVTASYGGSGVPEVDPKRKDKVPADKQGRDPEEAEAMKTLQASPARNEAALAAVRQNPPWAGPEASMIDLTTVDIPILAINGEFDQPNAKTHRMAREIKNFESIVLPGKSHLTAIMAGYMPEEYVQGLVAFINKYDAE